MAINIRVISKLPVVFGSSKSFYKIADVNVAFRHRQVIRFDFKNKTIQVKDYLDTTLN